MSGAVTTVAVVSVLSGALLLGLSLAIWPPMWVAGVMTLELVAEETWRKLRRLRDARRHWARASG
jgi:hypothetical protein